VPISGDIDWRDVSQEPQPIDFASYIRNLEVGQLEPKFLQTNTLKQAISAVTGAAAGNQLIDRYEYRSDIDTQRADKGLEVIGKELGSHNGFCVVKNGFDSLIKAIKRDLEKARVKIWTDSYVQNIIKVGERYDVIINDRNISCSKVIVTIPRDSVAELPCFRKLAILKQVEMRPLVRIYAQFPNKPVAWFEGMNKFVCPKPIRYVIPMNPKEGSIMISYTDGDDAEYWMDLLQKGELYVKRKVMTEIRKLFPDKTIPEPLLFKIFPWKDGCSYWTPGAYNIDDSSMNSIIPLPNSMPGVYMCGESWASTQSWVESALQQTKKMLSKF
jgi:protoporphyrinogen oxidase